MKKITLLVLAPLRLSACAVSPVDALAVPLKFSPNPKNAGRAGALSCNSISQVQVDDARRDKTPGVRTYNSEKLSAEVTAGSDPSAWVHSGMEPVRAQNGVTVQGKGPKLVVSIDTLHTTKSIWIDPAMKQRSNSALDTAAVTVAQLQGFKEGLLCKCVHERDRRGSLPRKTGVATHQESA